MSLASAGRRGIWCNTCFQRSVSRLLQPAFKYLADGHCMYGSKGDRPSGSSDTTLYVPIPIKPSNNPDDINVGVELGGKLNKADVLRVLNTFYKRREIKQLSQENGIDSRLFHQSYLSFRRFCLQSEVLPPDFHIILSDILQDSGHVDDIFPYFLQHAKQIFPHLECMDDLKKISDLRIPANWYPEARAMQRKIIFHAGPTNSGKTFHALERFLNAKSGVYCGPLKMLAVEVFQKSNDAGTPCDLVTGEERRYANPDGTAANHVSCTVEMSSCTTPYEVAVIDEVQMLRDNGRGWAWTRALLGICAEEIHLCGEEAAVDLVRDICMSIGEELELRKYKRLTKLEVLDEAVDNFNKIRNGDCIVCFSKRDIYAISRRIESLGRECAVIYGGLPPGTKLAQAKKFNEPANSCKVMIATDAIGMGLNLSIKRIIFYSLIKPTINENGEKEMDSITTSQALQIAGRAGRYGTQYADGEVTTFKSEDLPTLKNILSMGIENVEAAGLHPTAEQIELFAYHLPNATLSNLIDIFVSLSQVDQTSYFMCNVDDFKFLADMIQHVPLELRARYVFCCAPINKKMPFVCTIFLKFARQYSRGETVTFDWLCRHCGWPFQPPTTIMDLVHLEAVFDVLDLYLWLSYRFEDMFPDALTARDMQGELDEIIQLGVFNITKLLKNTETSVSTRTGDAADDEFIIKPQSSASVVSDELKRPSASGRLRGTALLGHQVDTKMDSQDDDDDQFDNQKYVNMIRSSKSSKFGQGSLTRRLIQKGLITPKMLERLQEEWESASHEEHPPTTGRIITKLRRNRKGRK